MERSEKYVFLEPRERGANMHVSQSLLTADKTRRPFNGWQWLGYWCELTDRMLFSKPVTSKLPVFYAEQRREGGTSGASHSSEASFKSGLE